MSTNRPGSLAARRILCCQLNNSNDGNEGRPVTQRLFVKLRSHEAPLRSMKRMGKPLAAEDVEEAAGQRAEVEQDQMQLHGGNPKDSGEGSGFGTGRDLERIAYAGFHAVFQGTEYETRGGDCG